MSVDQNEKDLRNEKNLNLLYELERLLEHQISQSNLELQELLTQSVEIPPAFED